MLARYRAARGTYQSMTARLRALVIDLLAAADLEVIQVEARPKDIDSFTEKIIRKRSKYADPLTDITDIVGLRIITYYVEDVARVGELIRSEVQVDEANSIDLAVPYRIGLPLVVSMRGTLGEANPSQVPLGRSAVQLLSTLGIQAFSVRTAAAAAQVTAGVVTLAFQRPVVGISVSAPQPRRGRAVRRGLCHNWRAAAQRGTAVRCGGTGPGRDSRAAGQQRFRPAPGAGRARAAQPHRGGTDRGCLAGTFAVRGFGPGPAGIRRERGPDASVLGRRRQSPGGLRAYADG